MVARGSVALRQEASRSASSGTTLGLRRRGAAAFQSKSSAEGAGGNGLSWELGVTDWRGTHGVCERPCLRGAFRRLRRPRLETKT
jgi:hypothetical protein